MLQTSHKALRRAISSQRISHQVLRASSTYAGPQEPNAPLELDPSLRNLLKDADMSLRRFSHKIRKESSTNSTRELEVLEFDETWSSEQSPHNAEDQNPFERKERKSARAAFGSRGIGSVSIPNQMREAIENIINGVSNALNRS